MPAKAKLLGFSPHSCPNQTVKPVRREQGANPDGHPKARVQDAESASAFADLLVGTDTDPTHVSRADQNFDGVVNGLDIQPFINCYLSP